MGNAKLEGAMQSDTCTIKGPIAADRWSRYRYWLGIPSVALSAVAGAAFIKEYAQVAVGLAALITVLTALMTFLTQPYQVRSGSCAQVLLCLQNRRQRWRVA